MHSATPLVQLRYEGATQDAYNLCYICGCCGSLYSGPHKWVRLDVSVVSAGLAKFAFESTSEETERCQPHEEGLLPLRASFSAHIS